MDLVIQKFRGALGGFNRRDVLQYMDEHFDPKRDSTIKLLYIENISNPDKLLFHASSLIRKGCRIAAIKSGASESGSRAASSHTGAIATTQPWRLSSARLA